MLFYENNDINKVILVRNTSGIQPEDVIRIYILITNLMPMILGMNNSNL